MPLCSNRPEGFVRPSIPRSSTPLSSPAIKPPHQPSTPLFSPAFSPSPPPFFSHPNPTANTPLPPPQGPLSHRYPHILTSCFIDTILLPLCTWLYLLSLLLLFEVFSLRNNRNNKTPIDPYHHTHPSSNPSASTKKEAVDAHETSTPGNGNPRTKRTGTQTALLVLYALLIAAQICMCVLEIVRLSLTHLGIGLLPFTFVSLMLALLLHLLSSSLHRSNRSLTFLTNNNIVGRTRRMWMVRWLNLGLWVGLIVCSVVKMAEEGKEGKGTRKGSKYPMSDEMVDVGVMVGVYVVVAVLEVVT